MELHRKVIRVGNSLAIRLRRDEAARLGVTEGDDVRVEIQGKGPGLNLKEEMFFADGKGSVDHDDEVADGFALRN